MDHIIVPALQAFEAQWHLSHVVRARGFLLLSGVTGTGEDGQVASDPKGQFEQTFVHLRLCLQAAGASLSDIVELTSYHVGLREHLDEFVAAKDRHIAARYPAWSAIGVSQLITEGALVEIRASPSTRARAGSRFRDPTPRTPGRIPPAAEHHNEDGSTGSSARRDHSCQEPA